MSTFIYTNPQLPGLEVKIEAATEHEANAARNKKFDENIDWLRVELTELWEVTTSW